MALGFFSYYIRISKSALDWRQSKGRWWAGTHNRRALSPWINNWTSPKTFQGHTIKLGTAAAAAWTKSGPNSADDTNCQPGILCVCVGVCMRGCVCSPQLNKQICRVSARTHYLQSYWSPRVSLWLIAHIFKAHIVSHRAGKIGWQKAAGSKHPNY